MFSFSGSKNVNVLPKGKTIPSGFKLAFFTNEQIIPTDENVANFNSKHYYRLNNPPKEVTAEIGDDGTKHIDVYDSNWFLLGPANTKRSITSVTILEKEAPKGGKLRKSRKPKRGGRKSRKNRRSCKYM